MKHKVLVQLNVGKQKTHEVNLQQDNYGIIFNIIFTF